MKAIRPLVVLLAFAPAAFASAEKICGAEACCQPKPPSCCAVMPVASANSSDTETKRFPLRGVITAVYAERSAIMVRHEEIPGVMRAMTMLFKVDEATLKAAKQGQAITAMMSRQGTDWWLHDVKLVAAKKG